MRWLCCHSLEEGIAERLQTIPPDVPRLDQQAIPHATIPDCASRLSLVSTLGKSAFDLTCSIEAVQLFGGEHEIETAEILLELRYLPCSNDGDYWHRLMAQPCERYLGHAATDLRGDRLHRRDDPGRALFLRKELLHSRIGQPRPVGLALAVILSGQHALRQRRPSHNPQVHSVRHRNKFSLDRSLHEAVLDLPPEEIGPASKPRQSICLGDPPSGSVRDADVKNLALANEIV